MVLTQKPVDNSARTGGGGSARPRPSSGAAIPYRPIGDRPAPPAPPSQTQKSPLAPMVTNHDAEGGVAYGHRGFRRPRQHLEP
ncbi:hypothetical protein EVAR_61054_1 [Eumeta japonica]|uniref:Uncharacterized protein n=1 Tax=Eumeta variegata TaxID=151549 RepID=A0A4C1Z7J9_EUMVA|nr:hypothetical protein EVAR_61054_1 [Eumeta japonica]